MTPQLTASQVKELARRAGIDIDAGWRYSETGIGRYRPWLWANEWKMVRREWETSQ